MSTTISALQVSDPLLAAQIIGPVVGAPATTPARGIAPGDYLPPQECLAETAWEATGFLVGRSRQAVCPDAHAHPGRVVLFGPLGVFDGLAIECVVRVVRVDRGHRTGVSPAARHPSPSPLPPADAADAAGTGAAAVRYRCEPPRA